MGKGCAKKPTRAQKIRMSSSGLIARNWLVIHEDEKELRLVSRGSGRTRVLKK